MKKVNILNFISILFVALIFVAASCTKEGPAGPPGKDGTDGTDGTNGTNGTDGTTTCIECHSDNQVLFAKSNQWLNSVHSMGGNFERNGTSCAPCHTSQGFLERMPDNLQSLPEAVANPNPVNCYTCHWIHKDYEVTDLALTYANPVDYWQIGSETSVNIDFGKGNLCANCHQMRVVSPWPTVGSTETYTITSYRWGPHHGPMAQLLGGFAGYEVPGSKTYTNSPHTGIENACVTCHMADAYGTQAGGHVMNVAYDYHGETVLSEAGCVECHPDGIASETEEAQAEVLEMLTALGTQLYMMGRLSEDGYLIGDDGVNLASNSNPATLSANVAGAYFNFKFIEEDRSMGIHNLKYTQALLTNSLESIQ